MKHLLMLYEASNLVRSNIKYMVQYTRCAYLITVQTKWTQAGSKNSVFTGNIPSSQVDQGGRSIFSKHIYNERYRYTYIRGIKHTYVNTRSCDVDKKRKKVSVSKYEYSMTAQTSSDSLWNHLFSTHTIYYWLAKWGHSCTVSFPFMLEKVGIEIGPNF